ncbi:MAG: CpsD/CapB family tyrosine-protein kinase [Chloroflexota bacterium]
MGKAVLALETGMVDRYRWLHTFFSESNREPPYTLGITSAIQGEGVTYVALRVAAVMTIDLGRPIAVVEAGLTRPQLAETFGVEAAPGLSEVLAGEAEMDAALRETSIPNLKILPGGHVPEHPSRLLRSPVMAHTLAALKERFDYVLLDTPAVLFSSDGVVLSNLCDGVLWVIRAGVTPMPAARRGLAMLAREKVVGVALNGSRLEMPRWLVRLLGI